MKRKMIIIAIVLVAIIIGIQRVDASVYNGKLYEVWDTESGVNVYAAESNGYMDYNSWMIKSSADDKIYYCIDPATPLVGSYEGSHNYIYEKSELINSGIFTESKYKKVSLLAYYGYGYKDEYVDHTAKKWYGITQTMIWRIMRPDLSWTFKKTRNGTPNNSYFASEVAEINKLVNNSDLYPSFHEKTYRLLTGTSITIEDTNEVFYQYIKDGNNSNYNVTRNGNKLIIYSESRPKKYNITYKFDSDTNNTLSAFVSADLQDIIRRGNLPIKYTNFYIDVYGGKITLQKLDEDKENKIAQGEATLKGAIYEVYNEQGNSVGRITTDDSGRGEISLDYGTYKIKEIKAPDGYNINDKEYNVTISSTNYNLNVETTDKVIKGKLKLHKLKGGSGEKFTNEKNAVFDIINNKGETVDTLKTNENGIDLAMLPYGVYKLKQKSGAKGYVLADEKILNIKENKVYEIDIKNLRLSKLEFTKKDYSTSKPIPNTTIEIYKENDELLYTGKTDKKGKIILPDLEIGEYYIIEKDAPKYYRLNNDKMYFEVKENGKIVKVNMKNHRKEGSLRIIKIDSETGKKLKSAKIEVIFTETNKKVYKGKTNKKGEIKIDKLVAGKYCIKEVKAPRGYEKLKNKECFEIEKENEKLIIVLRNDKKALKVPNTNAFKIIPIVASIMIVSSAVYLIYAKRN